MSTSLAMLHMWEQSLHLLQQFLAPAIKSGSTSACLAGLIVACEHVENQVLLAKLLELIPQTLVRELPCQGTSPKRSETVLL